MINNNERRILLFTKLYMEVVYNNPIQLKHWAKPNLKLTNLRYRLPVIIVISIRSKCMKHRWQYSTVQPYLKWWYLRFQKGDKERIMWIVVFNYYSHNYVLFGPIRVFKSIRFYKINATTLRKLYFHRVFSILMFLTLWRLVPAIITFIEWIELKLLKNTRKIQ